MPAATRLHFFGWLEHPAEEVVARTIGIRHWHTGTGFVNLPRTAAEAALKVTSEVKNALGLVPKAKEKTGFGIDTSDIHLGYYRFFESFIQAGDKVCWEAADAVARLITDREKGLLFVRRNWVPPPSWPR